MVHYMQKTNYDDDNRYVMLFVVLALAPPAEKGTKPEVKIFSSI